MNFREAFDPVSFRFCSVFQKIEIFIHPRTETQFIYHNKISRFYRRLHGVAGDGIKIDDKQS